MTISRSERLAILRSMKDEEISYDDAPPLTEEQLAAMTLFVPPEKRTVTIRLDKDVIEWLKARQPKGYQTLINAVLRDFMNRRSESDG